MTTPDTPAATTSRSGQLPGAMSQDTPGAFITHSPALPHAADKATPSRVQSMVSPVRGGTYSPVIATSTPLDDAQEAFDDVFSAYNKAVTLRQTQLMGEIYPALCNARNRLTAAQLGVDGINGTKRRVLGWSV